MTERDITKITDYPLIQKLAQALWQSEDDGHGVAIMVGAGFSRSAATTQDINKKMPIWANLAKKKLLKNLERRSIQMLYV